MTTHRTAALSPDGLYRYELAERWGRGRPLLWVMLNPSTADASQDDHTIRKVRGFTERFGHDAFVVVNLYAYRATDPARLADVADPVGPECDLRIRDAAARSSGTVVAWGAHPAAGALGRDRHVLALLVDAGRSRPLCLGKTKAGAPRHPRTLPWTAQLVPYGSGNACRYCAAPLDVWWHRGRPVLFCREGPCEKAAAGDAGSRSAQLELAAGDRHVVDVHQGALL